MKIKTWASNILFTLVVVYFLISAYGSFRDQMGADVIEDHEVDLLELRQANREISLLKKERDQLVFLLGRATGQTAACADILESQVASEEKEGEFIKLLTGDTHEHQ